MIPLRASNVDRRLLPMAALREMAALLANGAPAMDCEARLHERTHADESERDGVWIHYTGSIAASKLTPAYVDKCVGSPATGRNRRTVQTLAGLLALD